MNNAYCFSLKMLPEQTERQNWLKSRGTCVHYNWIGLFLFSRLHISMSNGVLGLKSLSGLVLWQNVQCWNSLGSIFYQTCSDCSRSSKYVNLEFLSPCHSLFHKKTVRINKKEQPTYFPMVVKRCCLIHCASSGLQVWLVWSIQVLP